MTFIHLTDTHLVGKGLLYGQDPAERLRAAVASINTEHADAAVVILTGGITNWGDPAAYTTFVRAIDDLNIPIHLIVGNHNDTPALVEAFPIIPHGTNGFAQTALKTDIGRF